MKKKILIVSSIVFLVLGAQCSSPKTMEESTQKQQVKQISIKEQMAKGGFLVDVRTREEFETGSVKGAVNIPLYEIENRIDEFKGKPYVILFCRSGHRAGIAKSLLESKGISNVTNGINADTINAELSK